MNMTVALLLMWLLALAAIGGFVWAVLSMRQMKQRFGPIIDLDAEKKRVQRDVFKLSKEIAKQRGAWETEFKETSAELKMLSRQLDHVRDQAESEAYGLYTPRYDFAESDVYKDRLNAVRQHQKEMIRNSSAAICTIEWTVEGSKAKGRQMTKRQLKLMLRAFNGECDAAISKVKYNNVLAVEERIQRAFDAINKLGEPNRCVLTGEYLFEKLQELYLAHEYQERKQEEKEEQRRIREQMREEERAQREIEKAKEEAEKEEERSRRALEKARAELESASTAKQAKLQDKIASLETRLAEAHANKERAISRAQLTKSGHVYIISNIGSFGEQVFKIGMTRRLEPNDRVKELGDASVPFPFDVHALIYSENAPELETQLHRRFDKRRLNLVNNRKEFFQVNGEELASAVKQIGGTVEFTLIAEAEEYRKSKLLREPKRVQPEVPAEPEIVEATQRIEERIRQWQDTSNPS